MKLPGDGPAQQGLGPDQQESHTHWKGCWFQSAYDVLDPDQAEVTRGESSQIEEAVKTASDIQLYEKCHHKKMWHEGGKESKKASWSW